ncbi:PIG-L family deacetylase [Fodinisporobacter ferrooxydans]|uniref:PIG-L family deacetylase n=1 Tax=Fodinisporobacter ferrooxydans TaxID=2901836 RepID=A0ABY4CPY5_9BACL|nr:PIG-L family deacetylase [Alicyclobacillaceae bacterium MYW30-H2]
MNSLNFNQQRVLILAPHADDETIGCGGIIQKFLKNNSSIRVVIASFVLGQYTKYKKKLAKYELYSGSERLKELQAAMQILGVADYHFLYTDTAMPMYHSRLDTIPKVDLVAKIESHIQEFQPTIVILPSKTKHQDHLVLHEAGITSCRPYFWNGSIFVYETDGEITFEPNLFLPLAEEELQVKMQALAAYQTQIGEECHPVHPKSIRIKAQFRGQAIYSEYAEAFQMIRLHG